VKDPDITVLFSNIIPPYNMNNYLTTTGG